MRFARTDAKAYARANLKGIWAAALTPFRPDGALGSGKVRPASTGDYEPWIPE